MDHPNLYLRGSAFCRVIYHQSPDHRNTRMRSLRGCGARNTNRPHPVTRVLVNPSPFKKRLA